MKYIIDFTVMAEVIFIFLIIIIILFYKLHRMKTLLKTQEEVEKEEKYGDFKIYDNDSPDIIKREQILSLKVMSDDDWQNIEIYLDKQHNAFVQKLRARYPMLSQDDIHIILLMRLGICNARIAAFLNIQVSSLATRRYRILKKMKEKPDGSIIKFVMELFNDKRKESDCS